MKTTYIKPEILTVEIELGSGAVICRWPRARRRLK